MQNIPNPMEQTVGLTAIVDTYPDKDRFLPRYLTVELLAILAKTLPQISATDASQFSPQANAFITAHKKQELFTPLTYSIFWRENPEQALAAYTESLDGTDKYSHSALTMALANEDFTLANLLIEKGANVFLEDKLVLEIALISILQRNEQALSQTLAGASSEQSAWVKEYLDYLYGYAAGKPDHAAQKRDVFNPTIRHFGQVLDTMVYFNGTPSHYGFISPSIEILTAHLQQYNSEIMDRDIAGLFSIIGSAFAFTQTICKFHGNLPSANASTDITKQIIDNMASKTPNAVVIFGGWAGNAVAIAFVSNTLVFSNLGVGSDPQHGTIIYALNNPANITAEKIEKFMRGLGNATAPAEILAIIGDMVDPKPLYTIKQQLNPVDNCIFVNPRAVVQGILLVLDAYKQHGSATAENLPPLANRIEEFYKNYINSLYMHSSEELTKFMRNHELLKNKRLECCSLALEYINQHSTEPDALQRCIELKNALEFVGLKDYYQQNIAAESQQTIQKTMIREQEIAAVKVIEQEYALSGKKT